MMGGLFVYGTLAPGRANAHMLANIPGSWTPARVRGRLIPHGWGATLGYPALVLDPNASVVDGLVFSSMSLDKHWATLDAFEGDGYERVWATTEMEDGAVIQSYVYVLSPSECLTLPDDF